MSGERTTVVFIGLSGTRYTFQCWPIETSFKALGGVYIVSRRSFDDPNYTTRATHRPLVIGHTADLSNALMSRSQREKLVLQGANCVCVCPVQEPARRIEIEADLIAGNRDFRGQLQSLYYLSEPETAPTRRPAGVRPALQGSELPS